MKSSAEKIYRFYASPEFLSSPNKSLYGKKMRGSLRRKRRSLMNQILSKFIINNPDRDAKKIPAFIKDVENQKLIREFHAYYRKNHSINDYSLKSIYSGGNTEEIADCGLIADICKSYLAMKKKSRKAPAKKEEKKEENPA